MFTKTKKWNSDEVFSGSILITMGISIVTIFAIVGFFEGKDSLEVILLPLSIGVLLLGFGIVDIVFGRNTIIESRPFDYTLKEPLQIKINRGSKPHMNTNQDISGRTLINNENSDEMFDHINFKKGDVIKIKTIEEHDISDKNNWRNARVYLFWKDELIEIPYEEITKQGIDKVIVSMYNYK